MIFEVFLSYRLGTRVVFINGIEVIKKYLDMLGTVGFQEIPRSMYYTHVHQVLLVSLWTLIFHFGFCFNEIICY